MKSLFLVLASLVAWFTCVAQTPGPSQKPATSPKNLITQLHSAVARTVYEEYVADALETTASQETEFAGLETNVTRLSAEQAREELAFLETMALTRVQLSDSRRAVLSCAQLTREEAELLLGELAATKARWDTLFATDVPARKAALVRQIDIAAVAVMPEPARATATEPAVRTADDILQAASRQLRPSGVALIGGEYHLLLDGTSVKAGQKIKVTLDRRYEVTLAAVTKNSFTLALDGKSIVVPMN